MYFVYVGISYLAAPGQLRHMGSRTLPGDGTLAPALGAWSLSDWTTREVLLISLQNFLFMGFVCYLSAVRDSVISSERVHSSQ